MATATQPHPHHHQGLDRQQEDMGYMSTLMRSMSLVLDEFYKTLRNVGVSAATGACVSACGVGGVGSVGRSCDVVA